MKNKRLFFLVLFLYSCIGGKTEYLFHDTIPVQEQDDRIYPLSLLKVSKKIDVLLVIDNSGSMQGIQNNVITNASLFFEQFAIRRYVDWKLGLVSTDRAETPYLGFETSFDSSLIDPRDPNSFNRTVETFRGAVSRLGTNGSFNEYVFYNTKRVLDLYNGRSGNRFQRDNAHLVVIMISDENEQSGEFGQSYEATTFLNGLSQYVDSSKVLRFYGALALKGLRGCTNNFYEYTGSQYEKIINLSDGFVISACINNFGNELARIGKDIASLVGLPSLLLRRRPVVETLKIYYEGNLLSSGRREDGGFWFYEEETNTINFYSIDFVQDIENDHFRIEFDIDDGINRDE